MRKITELCVKAFFNGEKFKRANSEVEVGGYEVDEHTIAKETKLFLHGHLIAKRNADGVFIKDAGWQTNTTKERLNGVLDYLNVGRIFQKDWTWYFGDNQDWPANEWVKVA